MTFLRCLIAFFLPVILSATYAQVLVTGKCIDKKGNLLPFIEVKATQVGIPPVLDITDKNGGFAIKLQPGMAQLVFSADSANVINRKIVVPNDSVYDIGEIQFEISNIDGVDIIRDRYYINGIPPLPVIDFQKNPFSAVEKYIVYTTAAVSNNELTNNYNVRGGNYDENLVYVNGFLINRPFLTRSGQQEGMSFIHTSLVKEVRFSAGGFQAAYGDKLSSVLDIQYKRPDTLHVSAMASLLGVEMHVEQGIGSRFRYLVGGRYRSNGYLLNSLPTKGNYNPVFWDAQFVTEFDITEKWQWMVLGHISSNNYQFSPVSQKTDFGTANEAYSFNIYFDGREDTRFLTMTGGTAFKYTGKKYSGATYFTTFRSDEREYFDIQGQYYINELETDPSKEEYGDSIAVLGVGTFMNHARNKLNALILSAYHDGTFVLSKNNELRFGLGVQHDDFSDILSEWRMIDSAGYSVPQNTPGVDLYEVIKGRLNLKNNRYHAYLQDHFEWKGKQDTVFLEKEVVLKDSTGRKITKIVRDTSEGVFSKWELDAGVRALYTSYNTDFMVTPRVTMSFVPIRYVYHNGRFERRSMKIRLAAGAYYQPPFYREFRTFDGGLNPDVVAQKSLHFVLGGDYNFYMWGREKPFKVSAETYYKYLWDINPYEIENVRTRYYADNIAKGYAIGFDANLHGEFVPGLESFFKFGVMSTKEDIEGDNYWLYYNAAGERITSISDDQVVADSAQVFPGYIRRPTDQRFNMGILFQDHVPQMERLMVQMGLNYGSRLPYGPPDFTRYKDTLSIKAYFRVDIGLSYDLLKKDRSKSEGKWRHKISDALVSFEVFNLLGINNVLSKQWIQDVNGNYYAIPNYLTQRRYNLKFIIRF